MFYLFSVELGNKIEKLCLSTSVPNFNASEGTITQSIKLDNDSIITIIYDVSSKKYEISDTHGSTSMVACSPDEATEAVMTYLKDYKDIIDEYKAMFENGQL